MTLHRAYPRKHERGFTMLEVLIAVLVFSLGMLGLAGLLIFAIQSNHVAYLRTQATFLAHNMAARMSANQVGLWGNGTTSDYNVTAIDPVGTPVPTCAAPGCSPADLATRDIAAWSQQLHTFLPNAAATIACATTGIAHVPPAAQFGLSPPYGGTCTMTISWNEATSNTGAQEPHSFEWVFQP
ncbi:MAG TPA: type IV pilus modification protein PilV [Rhodanobacteraceae bacterium]|nr:type IV pilus modification protein PilV [Rhodanobacteraceae bacterium]